jgi:hypothetical protein
MTRICSLIPAATLNDLLPLGANVHIHPSSTAQRSARDAGAPQPLILRVPVEPASRHVRRLDAA